MSIDSVNLTENERLILKLMKLNLSHAEIADRLNVSGAVITSMVTIIFKKIEG